MFASELGDKEGTWYKTINLFNEKYYRVVGRARRGILGRMTASATTSTCTIPQPTIVDSRDRGEEIKSSKVSSVGVM